MPVRLPAVMIGMATAPKATGAVLASSTTMAARNAEKPIDISITPVMATGAPKPARASIRPPKQKAIRIARMRGSSETRPKVARRSSKRPDTTVTWYSQMAVSTIQVIGKSPKTAPWVPASSASPAGILNAKMATSRAVASEVRPAQCAFHFRTPRVKNITRRGRRATSADSVRLPSGSS